MSKYKVALFDVDGVLIIPPKLFSEQYCENYGINLNEQVKFYATKEFQDASIGKFDLKDAIRIHSELWQWDGEPEELLNMWFEGENYPNKPLLNLIKVMRAKKVSVYLATQQEQYRASYLKEVIFKDKFDGIFCTCYLGYSKREDHFWKEVLRSLESSHPGLKPGEIAYFDDKQHLVDKAREFGIDAYLYTNTPDVKAILTK